MNLLSINQITKVNGDKTLFRDVSFGIQSGEKLALIGINGSGKTTLLNLLMGDIPPDSGEITQNRQISVGFLRQNPQFDNDERIRDYLFDHSNPRQRLILDYEALLKKMEHEINNDLQHQLDHLIEEINLIDGWSYESEVKEVLSVLGINDMALPLGKCSGGMIKKVALAKVLLGDHQLLMLDEPTNHLDMETILWLQGYLQKTDQAIFMVTHDRYFLDEVCNGIYEINLKSLRYFKGNYEFFLKKSAEIENDAYAHESRVKTILKRELQWRSQSPCARTSKSKFRLDEIDRMLDRDKPVKEQEIVLSIEPQRLGKTILNLKKVSKSFGQNCVIGGFSYQFKKGDKIGFIGPNGAGKTTLLNLITGALNADTGDVEHGINTHFGYFDQHSQILDPTMRVIDYLKEISEQVKLNDGSIISVGQLLEQFLFPNKLHYTPIENLSGGEKRRLQLLRVLMDHPNFLILDEPTNDLDIKTLGILEQFLQGFGGCLILVSHDRYFVDRITNYLFTFDGAGVVSGFVGRCDEYLQQKIESQNAQKQQKKPKVKREKLKTGPRKLTFKEKRELEFLEGRIIELEELIETLEGDMNSGKGDFQQLNDWSLSHKEYSEELETGMDRWAELADIAENS